MTSPVYSFLLSRFAAFYEEVAEIKVHAGDMAGLLQPDKPHEEIEPHAMAERIAARLLAVLDTQAHEVANTATETEMIAYRRTRYVMTALADEIFILDLRWPGAEHWPEYLLEYAVHRTRVAGREFFVLAQESVNCRAPSALDIEFAGVLLLALQLGFRGMYRGREGQGVLRDLRAKLYKLASAGEMGKHEAHAFEQAYHYTVVSDRDNTRVALAPWIRAAVYGSIGYLVLSSMVWLVLTWSTLDAIGRAI
ncbi:MAG TPA: DotU family type IV/VI secretion system protein [Luteibacter sp.]|jgi:type VI secretion system protein ImpK|nr:DotU family type IV/VI secretion system protein [Luteibacter sp.]